MNPDTIFLSDPDITLNELAALEDVLRTPRLSQGPVVELFENSFAQYLGRNYGVAVPSATVGLWLTLRAYGVGAGDEVIVSPLAWHQIAHAITLAGAKPVLADIDYWTVTLSPGKAEEKITSRTRAILAGNSNGHPAHWRPLQELAKKHGLLLLEDSSEAVGSRYQGQLVGSFGDCAFFDFSQPGPLTCGEGGMIITDDVEIARRLRYMRNRKPEDRFAAPITAYPPIQGCMSELTAALGFSQLEQLGQILLKRKRVEKFYLDHIMTFEGIKPPYIAPEVDEVHWFLYLVHLGTRFSKSSRDAILGDMKQHAVEAAAYCQPLHLQYHYQQQYGYKKTDFLVAEKISDRAIALPFHAHLEEDEVGFIVETAKDASVNVGAGSAIYL